MPDNEEFYQRQNARLEAERPIVICPAPQFHGNPYRYCPQCDWVEPPASEALTRITTARTSAQSAQAELNDAVTAAREGGHTWSEIALILGTSRQAAREICAMTDLAPPPRPPLCRYCGTREAHQDDLWCFVCLRRWRFMNNARAKLNLPDDPYIPTPPRTPDPAQTDAELPGMWEQADFIDTRDAPPQ